MSHKLSKICKHGILVNVPNLHRSERECTL